MKTKNEVSGEIAASNIPIGLWRDILIPDCCLLPPAMQKMKVHPEIFMKTKGDEKQMAKETSRGGEGEFKIQDEA